MAHPSARGPARLPRARRLGRRPLFRPAAAIAPRSSANLSCPRASFIAAAFLFLAYSNFRVTGSVWRLPYLEYEHRYNGAPAFIWQPAPVRRTHVHQPRPRRSLSRLGKKLRLDSPTTPAVFLARLRLLATDYFGYALGALALLGAFWRPTRWNLLALTSITIIGLPLLVSYLFMPHYQAPAAALGGLLAVTGLRRLFARCRAAPAIMAPSSPPSSLPKPSRSPPTPPTNARSPRSNSRRAAKIADALRAQGGRHLIFVRLLKPYYLHDTWVYNAPPIDARTVVWAWDRGPAENRLLMAYYPDRAAVLMTRPPTARSPSPTIPPDRAPRPEAMRPFPAQKNWLLYAPRRRALAAH